MIISNFTSIPSNASITEYVFAFNNSLNNYAVFSILIAILIVLTVAILFWRDDFIFAVKNATYLVAFGSFLLTLVKSDLFFDSNGDPLRLVSFVQFTFFLVILSLVVFYEQVSEK